MIKCSKNSRYFHLLFESLLPQFSLFFSQGLFPLVMTFKFDMTPHSLETLPLSTPNELIQSANEFLEGQWKSIKTYHCKLNNGTTEIVETFGRHYGKEYWLCRKSYHKNHKFEDFVKYLVGDPEKDIYDRLRYETQYIHVFDKWEPLPLEKEEGFEKVDKALLDRWCSVRSFYELGAPLKTREFNEFMYLKAPTPEDKSAYVIQLVSKKPVTSGHVHGVYVSIERVTPLDDGSVEWTMATSSDAGGNVPKWVQNAMISKSVSSDVPGFLNWLNRLNNQ